MIRAQEADQVAPGIHIWQAYDSTIKAEMSSTALQTGPGLFLVDPIPLEPQALDGVLGRSKLAGIFITNENHFRSSADLAATLALPIYVHRHLQGNAGFTSAIGVDDGEVFSDDLTAVAIDGGPPGEMALHHDFRGGTMVLGDALINFEPHGFGFLPAKYCLAAKQMRLSLRKLLDYRFDRMLFAHGTPILSNARARLELLLVRGR